MIISILNIQNSENISNFSINLAQELAKRGRVLLLDLDAQGKSTKLLNIQQDSSIFDLLNRDKEFYDVVKKTNFSNFFVLPSNIDVVKVEKNPQLLEKVAEVIKYLETKIDNIIIDTPPYLNSLVLKTLDSSNLIWIPLDVEKQNVYKTQKTLEQLENKEKIKIIPTNYSDENIENYCEIVKNFKNHLIKTGSSSFKLDSENPKFDNLMEKIKND
jgi:chromosome partitioning protein